MDRHAVVSSDGRRNDCRFRARRTKVAWMSMLYSCVAASCLLVTRRKRRLCVLFILDLRAANCCERNTTQAEVWNNPVTDHRQPAWTLFLLLRVAAETGRLQAIHVTVTSSSVTVYLSERVALIANCVATRTAVRFNPHRVQTKWCRCLGFHQRQQ